MNCIAILTLVASATTGLALADLTCVGRHAT